MDVTFQNPVFLWFLLLIPLLVLVHFYSLHYVRQKAMRFANFEALEKILQTKAIVPKNYLLLAMRIFTLAGFTLAASGVTLHYLTVAPPYDYVVAIDTSNSMLASDMEPSRMQAALTGVQEWLSAIAPGAKVGIVQFSSQARVALPPTKDTAQASRSVAALVPDKSGGTALCEAIKASANQFSAADNSRAVVLISDGQNNAGCLLSEGIEYARRSNVTVFAIGIGSRAGGRIEGLPDVVFTLDETDLRSAAEGTDGKYFRVERSGELAAAFSEFSKPGVRDSALDLSVPIMILAFLFVFVDWGLSITRYRTIP